MVNSLLVVKSSLFYKLKNITLILIFFQSCTIFPDKIFPEACPGGATSGPIYGKNGQIIMFVEGLSTHNLHEAVEDNKFECIEEELKKGADINVRDGGYVGRGNPPLFYATNLKMVQFLIDKGADVHFKNDIGETFLHTTDNKEIAEFLIKKKGLKLNEKNRYGYTPLHTASMRASLEVMEVFVENGAKPDISVLNYIIVGAMGYTESNLTKNKQTVEFFLNHGVDINTKDETGATPLYYATYNSIMNPNFLKILIQKNANLNIRNNKGETALFAGMDPLHFIPAESLVIRGIQPLLEAGADPNIKNKEGITILDIASSRGREHKKVVSLLRSYNAKTSKELDR